MLDVRSDSLMLILVKTRIAPILTFKAVEMQ